MALIYQGCIAKCSLSWCLVLSALSCLCFSLTRCESACESACGVYLLCNTRQVSICLCFVCIYVRVPPKMSQDCPGLKPIHSRPVQFPVSLLAVFSSWPLCWRFCLLGTGGCVPVWWEMSTPTLPKGAKSSSKWWLPGPLNSFTCLLTWGWKHVSSCHCHHHHRYSFIIIYFLL
jgi:hypothetical protein